VANRRISEFPAINGNEIDEQDLLTLVHVFEVDPVLRNKKITFTEFRNYLDQYYANVTGETITGNVTINGNLTVLGSSSFNTVTSSGLATFSGVVIQNNLTTSGSISGNAGTFSSVTSATGVFTSFLSGQTITGNSFQATTITGVSGVFTGQVSGATVTGTNASFTTGTFATLIAGNHTTTGNHTVSGNLYVSGSGFFASGISVTGTISGQTITGTSGSFVSGTFTALSGGTVTGNTGSFGTITGITGVFTNQLSGQTITGERGIFTSVTGVSGVFTSFLSGATITGTTVQATTITGVSGVFTSDISGVTIQATSGTFGTISGNTYRAGGVTFVSGSGDVRPYGLFSFPTIVGVSGRILSTNGDGTTTWVANSGGGGYAGGDFIVYDGNLIVSGSGYFSSGINVTGVISGASLTTATGVFASGTVSNPSVVFVADLNTGAYSDVTDTFSVAIGGSSGVTISSGVNGMILTIWGS